MSRKHTPTFKLQRATKNMTGQDGRHLPSLTCFDIRYVYTTLHSIPIRRLFLSPYITRTLSFLMRHVLSLSHVYSPRAYASVLHSLSLSLSPSRGRRKEGCVQAVLPSSRYQLVARSLPPLLFVPGRDVIVLTFVCGSHYVA